MNIRPRRWREKQDAGGQRKRPTTRRHDNVVVKRRPSKLPAQIKALIKLRFDGGPRIALGAVAASVYYGSRAGTSGRRDVERRLVYRPRLIISIRRSMSAALNAIRDELRPKAVAARTPGELRIVLARHARSPRTLTFRGDSIVGRHTRGSRRRAAGAGLGRPRDPEAAGRHARRSGRRCGRGRRPPWVDRPENRRRPDGAVVLGVARWPLRTAGAARGLAQERVASARAVRFIGRGRFSRWRRRQRDEEPRADRRSTAMP